MTSVNILFIGISAWGAIAITVRAYYARKTYLLELKKAELLRTRICALCLNGLRKREP